MTQDLDWPNYIAKPLSNQRCRRTGKKSDPRKRAIYLKNIKKIKRRFEKFIPPCV
jgi:hypothetical protein